jgi:hypothetical protein
MRQVARSGRWLWGLCGLVTAAALAVPGARLIVSAGDSPALARPAPPPQPVRVDIETRTVTVSQPVTSLNVQGYDGLMQVTAAPVTHVQVIETIAYYGTPPAVVQSVSSGRLTLADPACANDSCSVSFDVRVPPSVSVTATGGPVVISGISGATLNSGGTPVSASDIHGPLTVTTGGGPLQIDGLTGPLRASTDGGQVIATDVTAPTTVVTTGSGPAQIAFASVPESVTVSTDGGLVTLHVPGGPYALTANSDGAPQLIGIATSAAAPRSITVITGGGALIISSRKVAGNQLPPPPHGFIEVGRPGDRSTLSLPVIAIHLGGHHVLTLLAPLFWSGAPRGAGLRAQALRGLSGASKALTVRRN